MDPEMDPVPVHSSRRQGARASVPGTDGRVIETRKRGRRMLDANGLGEVLASVDLPPDGVVLLKNLSHPVV